MTQLSEETIKDTHLIQEMFLGAFQNGLKAGNFNEYFVQKLAALMEEIMTREEYHIKGE